jgi:phytoene desaturase
MSKKVLIVGAGLGGLCTSIRLKQLGFDVSIIEKFNTPGGRLNVLKRDGFTFDMGPSFFSMSYEFKAFERETGIQLPFDFVPLDPLYRVHISGQKQSFNIYKDLKKLAIEFENVEPGFEKKMEAFLQSAGKLFHDSYDRVVKRNFDSIGGFLWQLTKVPMQHAPKVFRSVWEEMGRYFSSQEVKQIFSLVAFFLGATPFDTPAIYSLLNYTELKHDGYYNVKGGMYKIVEALASVIESQNIPVHYNTEIVDFTEQDGRLTGLVDQNQKKWMADIYVVNADAAWFRGQVLGRKKFSPKKLDAKKWTLAPLTLYLGIDRKIPALAHHNYFLGSNFKEYAAKIFKNGIKLEKPYYYVNVQSGSNPESAPEGCESVFILCPVPDLRYKPDWEDQDEIVENIINDLSQRIGMDLKKHIVSQTVYNPMHWQNMFNLYRGSGLGLAHDLNQIGGFRPKNYDEQFKNLFYTGASTVPGTGLPMVVISSKLVTARIIKSYGSVS